VLGVVSRRVESGLPVKVDITNGSPNSFKTPSIELERTAEVPAVSGISGEVSGERENFPDIPKTNLSQDLWKTIVKNPDTGKITIDQDLVKDYLDYKATSPSTLGLPALKDNRTMCGCLALVGQDEDGNRIAKRLFCGREWCSDCGLFVHRRRISRVLSHLFQIDWMGYGVITFPLEVRLIMRDPQVMRRLAKKLRKLLRRRGYRKVYTRWHFFGEHGEKYHPHLNVLLDGGYLSPEELAELKDSIRRKLLPRAIANRIGKDLVIHYDYTQESKRKMHWIKYVTKASFTDRAWDEPLADALHGFHNGCFAGFWNDPPKWHLTGTDKKFNALLPLAEGKHPVSGKPIVWNRRPIPFVLVLMEEPVDIGGGYYLLPTIRPPPTAPLRPTNLTELPDGDYRKHPNHIRKEIDRHRELLSRREDCDFAS